ncbi:hypothetical protein F511_45735 [Dorcoceras hygrometricum]|uniref:Uncharacterized protein n=1 Tax=Dorcoceras hygrometricum TaxID=472368 RepID=A0A2Z6ZVR7_9LAMI|nr:hypothetical protein F511_45735 [Dorcoceras hygrometricum]
MESAAGLAMETSKVKSVAIQEAKKNRELVLERERSADEERSAGAPSVDDISSDVITIQQKATSR